MWYDVYYKLIVYIVRSGQELLCTKKAGYDAGLNETMAKCLRFLQWKGVEISLMRGLLHTPLPFFQVPSD
jgi:hypothetical protein